VLTKPDAARLFFAVWPAPDIQQSLGELARNLKRECGGRAIPSRHIHLTLAFLGNVDRDRLVRLAEIANAAAAPRFELAVTRIGYWRHNRIVWAGVERCPETLRALAGRLEEACSVEGFRVDKRPYVPHITLVRDARIAPSTLAIGPIYWPASSFALVESAPAARGREYRVLWDCALTA